MKRTAFRTLLTVFLAAILIFPAVSFGINPSKLLRSVTTLSVLVGAKYRPICSISAIDSPDEKHYWLTAAHCVIDGDPVYINDEQAVVIMLDERNDLAILETLYVHLPGLRLAKKGPGYGDKIAMVGYAGPLEMAGPIITFGYVASPYMIPFPDQEGWDVPYMILQIAGAPGNSGSPVVNYRDEIVSVLQWGFGRAYGVIGGGVIFDSLSQYREYWD